VWIIDDVGDHLWFVFNIQFWSESVIAEHQTAGPENWNIGLLAPGEFVAIRATIVCAEPQLLVTDIEKSCEFFRDKLTFHSYSVMARLLTMHRCAATGAPQSNLRQTASN
jgi:hypothetical protein